MAALKALNLNTIKSRVVLANEENLLIYNLDPVENLQLKVDNKRSCQLLSFGKKTLDKIFIKPQRTCALDVVAKRMNEEKLLNFIKKTK